ncbi:RNA polymerase sigma factor SigF, partial [Plantactinospora sp. B5E13]
MTATTNRQVVTPHTTATPDPATLTDSATNLLHTLAALPTNHPDRATLRDKTIEAWLPLANHL